MLKIKGTGYNGSPKELPHCENEGCYMVNNHSSTNWFKYADWIELVNLGRSEK